MIPQPHHNGALCYFIHTTFSPERDNKFTQPHSSKTTPAEAELMKRSYEAAVMLIVHLSLEDEQDDMFWWGRILLLR
jgi:hypothetical protein